MIEEQKKSSKNNLFVELIMFAMVFSIGSLLEYCILFIPQLLCLRQIESGKGFIELLKLMIDTEYMTEVMDRFPQWYNIVMLFSTVGIIASTVMYCKMIDNRSLSSIGIDKTHPISRYIVGIVIGTILLSIAVLVNLLCGTMNIHISDNISFTYIALIFIGYIIQGFSEEILCRGYFMSSLSKSYNVALAVIVNSIVFALLHISNKGITVLSMINLFLFAVLLSLIVLKDKNIWLAAALHTAWNFTQGNLFGIRVSGIDSKNSILSTESIPSKDIINGGSFGIEGSIVVTILLTIIISLILAYFSKKSEKK